MPNTAPNVFLDTNVLVDYHLGRQPQGGACTELIDCFGNLEQRHILPLFP